ncbi:transmembrane 4 L6 family member 5-like, partial [Clarias magur]
MCTGRCSRLIAMALYPLAVISIACNIMLFFPEWTVTYVQDGHITQEVKYMGGLIGGGLMVIAPAMFIHITGKHGRCANRCGMFVSIMFAAIGVLGALYSFGVATLGLINALECKGYFTDKTLFENRLSNLNLWRACTEPGGVVEFNVGLFSTLLACSALQLILCASQMINGLIGCICGVCIDKG